MNLICICVKLTISFFIAIVFCSFFCYIYCNPPRTRLSLTGSTGFVGIPGCFFSDWREGGSCGVTDKKGFRNLASVPYEEPGILLMGSSHMEAVNVSQNKSCSALINEKLPHTLVLFNIGQSGNFFPDCTCWMRAAMSEFHPRKYVIIETPNIEFDNILLGRIASGQYRPVTKTFYSRNFVDVIQRIPLFRALGKQFLTMKSQNALRDSHKADPTVFPDYYPQLKSWLAQIALCASEYHIVPIILYYSHFTFQRELGEQHYLTENPRALDYFREACEENGIKFIDMTEDFERHFHETYEPAYGFINTAPGAGHLNKVGHRLIADRLYKEIMEMEGLAE